MKGIIDMLKVESCKQIIERSKKLDQIIFFGAGKRLEMCGRTFQGTEAWDKVNYVVDNDEKKQNTEVTVWGKKLKVISLKELKEKQYGDYVIVITCGQYEEIQQQLEGDCVLKNVDYYCFSHLMMANWEEDALQKEIPSDIRISKELLIPKTIHYCWFGGNPLPDQYKVWMESWHKFCPDYQIIEWNESNYDVSKNAYMYQAYKSKKWGFVPDYARLDIIYHHGGIYLDTDVELIQNLDDLLYQEGFAGFENSSAVNLGQGFGAVPGLPIIKEMLDIYKDMQFINADDGSLNMIASPHWQTMTLKEHGLRTDGEYQIIDGFTVYPEKVLCGKSFYTRRIRLKPYTRAIHHFDGSWLEEETKNKIKKLERELNSY